MRQHGEQRERACERAERANPSLSPSDPSLEYKGNDPVGKTLDEIINLESLEKTASERIAERIAGFTGSMFFVWLHVVWFSLWIGLNLSLFSSYPMDPFP